MHFPSIHQAVVIIYIFSNSGMITIYRVIQTFCDISEKRIYFEREQENNVTIQRFRSGYVVLRKSTTFIDYQFTIIFFHRIHSTKESTNYFPYVSKVNFFHRFFDFWV